MAVDMPTGDREYDSGSCRAVVAKSYRDMAAEDHLPGACIARVLERPRDLVEHDAGGRAGGSSEVEDLSRAEARSGTTELQAALGDAHIGQRDTGVAPASR